MLALSACLLAGCGGGSSRPAVQGTVTFDGAPVDGGKIMFIATDSKGINANANIVAGKYALAAGKGPSVGAHKVEIVWYKKTGKQVVGSDPPNKIDETIQVIPEKYNAKSSVTEQIKAGANTLNYELKFK